MISRDENSQRESPFNHPVHRSIVPHLTDCTRRHARLYCIYNRIRLSGPTPRYSDFMLCAVRAASVCIGSGLVFDRRETVLLARATAYHYAPKASVMLMVALSCE